MCKRGCPNCGENITIRKIFRSTYKRGEDKFKCKKCDEVLHVDWGKGIVYLMLPVILMTTLSFDFDSIYTNVIMKFVLVVFIGIPLSSILAICKVPIHTINGTEK